MVRTLPSNTGTRPDPSRILALAAAIAIHVLAFLLLLVPMTAPQLGVMLEKTETPPWVQPIEVVRPPIPPEIVSISQPTQTPQAAPRVVQQVETPVVEQIIVDDGTIAADPAPDTSSVIADATTSLSTPLTGVQLEYETAPPPPYPSIAARSGLQGQVLLKILVGTDGKPLDVQVSKGSGHRILDETAKRFVLKHWRFKPAMQNGQAVQAYGLVPIDFTMQ
jgi:protein TonB